MKKITFVACLVLLAFNAYAVEVWALVHSELNNGKFYCTYQLNGSSYQTTTVSIKPCEQMLVR